MQSQEEIAKLLDYSLKDKNEVTMSEFKEITQKETSAIYLCVNATFNSLAISAYQEIVSDIC